MPGSWRPTGSSLGRVGAGVLFCGLATLDVVQTVDRVPAANEKVVARGLDVAAGGPAANAAVACATLGVRARLVTRVGGGPLGAAVLGDLAAAGVDVVDLAGPGHTPPVSTVLVTAATGERAVVSVNATVGGASLELPPNEVPADAWDGAGVVLVDGHHLDLALDVARAARARGIPVLLDGGSWKPGLEGLLALVDVAVVSADFAVPGGADDGGSGRDVLGDVLGDVLADVHALGPRVVARSAGGGPIAVLDASGARHEVPVPRVAVVDTLGAGDVLHGALAAWWATAVGRGGGPGDGGPGSGGPDGGGPGGGGPLGGPDTPDAVAGLAWAATVASASCAAAGARGWARDAALVARLRAGLRAG